MNRTTQPHQFGPKDRIAAFAKATEVYAESLEDPDLANVYWGKSLGLWQALTILSAGDRVAPGRRLGGARLADRGGRAAPARSAVAHRVTAAPGR